MTGNNIIEMIDMLFDLDGGTLPAAYPFALWAALIRCVPQLAEEKSVGVLPLRGIGNNEELLLPKRAKLAMRLPATLANHVASHLTGQQLDITGNTVRLGAAKARPIQPYPTIHAQLVTGASDEVLFMEDINKQMGALGVTGKLICGKRLAINGGQKSIQGYSLVLHDLRAEASLQLQYLGLGEDRQFGCGIFIPYKVISGLSED
ncbi:MAG: type I-MYXAN CRISPR-associated protein Cas6/Cmx6 [Betaproteobacteria bacterium RBG_16_56_24]|nr:MAG: type I-MYXAN CRISPR-associated protein Cas6/Cmx6 [Betaproteobacteria bacterium RBG_16_56_24]